MSVSPERRMAAALVTGFLTPIYSQEVRRPDGSTRHVHGLVRADLDRVLTGYACGECLATYSTYLDVCPACFLPRSEVGMYEQTPEHWQDWYDEGNQDRTPYTKPGNIDTFMQGLLADGDVDHARLSQLKAKRRGARSN